MMLFILVLAIAVAFAAGWVYAPKGTLTKIVATISLTATTAYEWLSEQWFMLREIVPPEYGPWLLGMFLVLTVAAAVRPSGAGGRR